MLRFCWYWIACITVLTFIVCGGSGMTIAVDSSLIAMVGLVAASLAGAFWCRRQANTASLVAPFQCMALLAAQVAVAFLQYPVARLDRPLIDAQLVAIDNWLHFDWPSCFAWVLAHPPVRAVLSAVYISLGLQSLMVCLVALRDPRRAGVCLVANALILTCCLVTYAVWPAGGAFAFFHPPGIISDYVDQFMGARLGTILELNLGQMTGIIQYPSYHAAAAVILLYAFWGLPRWIAFCATIVETILCLSAVPIGGHHLIDVIAGGGLAATMIAVVNVAVRPRPHDLPKLVGSLLPQPKPSS